MTEGEDVDLDRLGIELDLVGQVESSVPGEQLTKLGAVLDLNVEHEAGAPVPLLWHWVLFTRATRRSALGIDGHPQVLPGGATSELPRRMWVGGHVEQTGEFRVGEHAWRESVVTGARRRIGKTGPLLFVTVRHVVRQRDVIVLEERQELAYMAIGDRIDRPVGNVKPKSPESGWAFRTSVDLPTLVRFSGLTFNSHRIHYDVKYARERERYPDLVVHGPLTAILLCGTTQSSGGSNFEFKATAPLFSDTEFTLLGEPTPDGPTNLTAVRNDGTVAMTARRW